MATSEDVARRAGLSRSTVSRALSGSSLISAATRERVQEAAEEIGYQPNVVAQNLARRSSRTLALGVFPEHGSAEHSGAVFTRLDQPDLYFYLHVLESMENEAVARGYDLLLPSHPYSSPAQYVRTLKTRHVAGTIMLALSMTDPRIQAMIDADIPTVFVDVIGHGRRTTVVRSDNVDGMRQATEYILQLNHRRVAVLTGHAISLSNVERLSACQQAFARAGVEFDHSLVRQAGFGLHSAHKAILSLLEERRDFTAILALSDVMAIGALRALHERGVRVPEDVSLIGFDDIVFSSFVTPSLTTVAQDGEAMGRSAVRLLIDMIDGTNPQPQPLIIPTRLIVRQSTGPPPT